MTYKVKLDVFEGPLDLLLHLIKQNDIDIYNIPIAEITRQYLEYMELMRMLDLDIAGEFLVMAATLMHIKSKMLLPPSEEAEEQEEVDPREELVRRLLEYKKFKEAAENLAGKERPLLGMFTRSPAETELDGADPFFEASLFDLIAAFKTILKDIPKKQFYEVIKDEVSVADKMHELYHILKDRSVVYFSGLFKAAKSKLEIIATFLALLELIRLKEVIIKQAVSFGEIEIIRNPDAIKPKSESPQTTQA